MQSFRKSNFFGKLYFTWAYPMIQAVRGNKNEMEQHYLIDMTAKKGESEEEAGSFKNYFR